MSVDDLENYEAELELKLYKEYRDIVGLFSYAVETERRFYLANEVQFDVKASGSTTYFEIALKDAWVWDVYRPARFVKSVKVVSFKDVNIEEIPKSEQDLEFNQEDFPKEG